MSLTLKEQAWQSGLVLVDETAQWNETDWPPLKSGWRSHNASVVLDHPDKNDNHNLKGQTVVVLGGLKKDYVTNSVLELNLSESNKQWQDGPPMNKSRRDHAAVVCNGGIYVMGGYNGNLVDYTGNTLDCIERIAVDDLLQSPVTPSTSRKCHWTTLTIRLSTERWGCCAVAVHNRYIVVMGGRKMRGRNWETLSSVDIIDTSNHTVIAGPSMSVPRSFCSSAVIGHRIFVIGGYIEGGKLDSVEILDFAKPCYIKERNDTLSTSISFVLGWTTHSDLVLSNPWHSCTVVTVGSCLVVAENNGTVEILDTHHNRMWNLPPLGNRFQRINMVTVGNQIAVIGGRDNPACATLPLMDKNTWCFCRLCEQPPNEWFHSLEEMGIRESNVTSCSTSVNP